jgi:hypothetical protein
MYDKTTQNQYPTTNGDLSPAATTNLFFTVSRNRF